MQDLDAGLSPVGPPRRLTTDPVWTVDGLTWTRFPDQPVLPLTPGAFDSTSQTYASVVEMGEEIWLFYTGDGLGTTGVGLATLKKSELQSGSVSVNSRIRSR